MPKELEFPHHYKCPRCKSDAGVLQTLTEREKAEGLLPKELPVAVQRVKILLAEDGQIQSGKLTGKTLRQVFFYTDICSNCGQQYIYLAELKDFVMPALPKTTGSPDILIPGAPEMPPGFGFPNRAQRRHPSN